jgi:hypothetical protein
MNCENVYDKLARLEWQIFEMGCETQRKFIRAFPSMEKLDSNKSFSNKKLPLKIQEQKRWNMSTNFNTFQ